MTTRGAQLMGRNGITLLALLLAVGFGCAGLQQTAEPAKADWQFDDIVDVAFVQPYATMPQPKGVMIIDSRPYVFIHNNIVVGS